MGGKLQRWANNLATHVTLIQAGGAVISAVAGGWVTAVTKVFEQYAPASWFFGGLLAALVFLSCYAFIEFIDRLRGQKKFFDAAQRPTGTINPLAEKFDGERINLLDFKDPLGRSLPKKIFTDCELIGPVNLFFLGGTIESASFANVDFVLLRDDKPTLQIFNAIVFEELRIYRSTLIGMTIYVPPRMAKALVEGCGGEINWLTKPP